MPQAVVAVNPPEVRVVFAADDVGTADQGAVCDASVRILPALARRRAGDGHTGGVYPHLAVPVVPHCDVELEPLDLHYNI